MRPYYADESVTLYHGDCREVTEWLAADVLVTDPPYGRGWRQGRHWDSSHADDRHAGIQGDTDTSARDCVLELWGDRPALAFGDLMLAPPPGTKLVGVYRKPSNAGTRGAMAGFRRDAEAIYWIGPWPTGLGGRSSVLTTGARTQGMNGPQGRYGHPHAKPVDVMEQLIAACPAGVVADPFAGAGSTLEAARRQGRRVIGVEVDERYCELIAKRMSQGVLIAAEPLPSLTPVGADEEVTG